MNVDHQQRPTSSKEEFVTGRGPAISRACCRLLNSWRENRQPRSSQAGTGNNTAVVSEAASAAVALHTQRLKTTNHELQDMRKVA